MAQPDSANGAEAPRRFRRILVAFDGSPHAERALAAAAQLAELAGGELTALSVVPEISAWMLSGGMGAPLDIPELQEDARREASKELDDAVDALPRDLKVTKTVEIGRPGPDIVKRASSGGHDLVVVGSRGRGEAAALFLGSVSQHVSHGSSIPVLIVR